MISFGWFGEWLKKKKYLMEMHENKEKEYLQKIIEKKKQNT
jgi:hypothetical protein